MQGDRFDEVRPRGRRRQASPRLVQQPLTMAPQVAPPSRRTPQRVRGVHVERVSCVWRYESILPSMRRRPTFPAQAVMGLHRARSEGLLSATGLVESRSMMAAISALVGVVGRELIKSMMA